MDALFARVDAIHGPVSKRRKTQKCIPRQGDSRQSEKTKGAPAHGDDRTLDSVALHTALPKSLRPTEPAPENLPKYSHISNKKLRTQLTRQSTHTARLKLLVKDAEMLLTEEAGLMEVDGDMEKTWRVGQSEVVKAAGQEAAQGRKEWMLDGGPYRSRYTRNGRCASRFDFIPLPKTHTYTMFVPDILLS